MDGHRFDDLTRKLAAGASRRAALKGLLVGTAAALGWRHEADAVMQVTCGNVVCASDPSVCNEGCSCCVFSNGNSRCMPPNQCLRLGGEILCPAGQTFDPSTGGCVVDCATVPAGTQCDTGKVCSGGMCQGNGVCTDLSDEQCSASCGVDVGSCAQTPEGAFVCAGGVFCGAVPRCRSSADCAAGYVCEQARPASLCHNICRPICT